ncbi:AraC family transcriptional regulator [Frondihabitans sp. VKM Ac-2883]|uniref:helix-turn-helix transcriptional regulator n=1 Tax=Frondihabitans sp. VKM Ac-2883 TaxID=2783823 RepID=UPI00188B71C8|nr:helix-turn-helix transcriptional regulator [Frondihabitans sp. VKM Ac-2883]
MSPEKNNPIRTEVGGRDLDQARAMYEDDYNGRGFTTGLTEADFAYRYTVAGDDEMTLRSSMFLGEIRGAIQPENEYVVAWLTEGRGIVDASAEQTAFVRGRPMMFPTGKQFDFEMSTYKQSLIHFNAGFLERVAAEEEGTLPGALTFHHTAVPSASSLQAWRDTVGEVAKTILRGEASALARSEANRRAAVSLLRTFSHTGPQLPEALLAPRNGRLREAVEYMHSHADQTITPTTVAQHAGLSLRGLQAAFKNQLDISPTDYLRGIRYDRARVDLLNLAPGEVTVSAIADRWGFTHAGRFAAGYAARFGESPSATLAR